MSVMEATASSLVTQLRSARDESDCLFNILKPDAVLDRPIAERHRVLFYIGHLDGFDSIQICREGLGLKSPDPELDVLFQSGIDPDATHLPTDSPSDWPSLDRIHAYVSRCRDRVDRVIDSAPEEVGLLALEHRFMHLETLAYMLHNFPHDRKCRPAGTEPNMELRPQSMEFREVPAGEAVLGMPRGSAFGWDNEFGEKRLRVAAFRMSRFPVTNGQYLEFVRQGAAVPNFWSQRGKGFFYRGMFEDIPLPHDWPVYVTQSEALAYAGWKGLSLASEEQFHRAAYGTPSGGQRAYPWGPEDPLRTHGNFGFKRWDPESVFATPDGDSAVGLSQLVGNGWEWTNTPFAPFPGFEPRVSYPGYSANFFDGEHFVMKGGSCRTATRLLRSTFRNWFRRDYPYVYAKFRCVEN